MKDCEFQQYLLSGAIDEQFDEQEIDST